MSSKGSLFGEFGFVKPKKESKDKGLCPPDTMFRICSYLQRLYIVLKILGYPIYYFFTCALLKCDHEHRQPKDEEDNVNSTFSSHKSDNKKTFRDDEGTSGSTAVGGSTDRIISGGAVREGSSGGAFQPNDGTIISGGAVREGSSGGAFQPYNGSDSHDTCCCMGSCTCASCVTAAIQQQPINNTINSRNSTAAKVVQNKAESNAVLRIESRTAPPVFLNPFTLYSSSRDSVGKEKRTEEISAACYPEKLDYYRLQSLFYPPNCSIFLITHS